MSQHRFPELFGGLLEENGNGRLIGRSVTVVVTSAKAERRGNFRRGVSSRVDCTGAGAICSGICINPAQDALNCLEMKIFDGGFSRSAARRIFQSMISPRRQLPQFHRPAADALAGRPHIRRRNGFVDRETNSHSALKKWFADIRFEQPRGRRNRRKSRSSPGFPPRQPAGKKLS